MKTLHFGTMRGMCVWLFLRSLAKLRAHEVAVIALLILCAFAVADEFLRWMGSP